jgi:predicted transcriptional regulator
MDLADIKKLRIKAGMSQTALAKKAGVSQAHIAKIESGKVDPRFSTVSRIFRCLQEGQRDHCARYMTPHIFGVQFDSPVTEAGRIMRERDISQVVVFNGEVVIGLITEEDLLRFKKNTSTSLAREVMGDTPPIVSKTTSAVSVRELLLEFPAVIVMDRGKALGLITRSDILRHI